MQTKDLENKVEDKIIDLQEIIDYANCPMVHYFKWTKGIPSKEIALYDKYAKDFTNVIYYCYNRIQDHEPIRIEDIKQMWGKIWVLDKRRSDIIFSDSNIGKETYNTKRVEGLKNLLSYREYLLNNQCFPIIINYPYILEIDGIRIKGNIDVVKEVKNDHGQKEILLCSYIPDTYNLHLEDSYGFKLNTDLLALKEMIGDNIQIKKRIFNVTKSKETIKQVYDINEKFLKHNLKTIYNQIRNHTYYICPGVKCKSCIYRSLCKDNKNIIDII